jgi:hypothetical protein
LRQVPHDVEDLADELGIERGGGLVEQHELQMITTGIDMNNRG